ncbi:MAG: DNA polymerase III subunit gamma/tau [Planctomycetia bacterium]|nr:DNA polymerase III subunit gamma/tau [Planctomycetia bacterium]
MNPNNDQVDKRDEIPNNNLNNSSQNSSSTSSPKSKQASFFDASFFVTPKESDSNNQKTDAPLKKKPRKTKPKTESKNIDISSSQNLIESFDSDESVNSVLSAEPTAFLDNVGKVQPVLTETENFATVNNTENSSFTKDKEFIPNSTSINDSKSIIDSASEVELASLVDSFSNEEPVPDVDLSSSMDSNSNRVLQNQMIPNPQVPPIQTNETTIEKLPQDDSSKDSLIHSVSGDSLNRPTSVHYQVVARRYRPLGFEQLIGQDHIATALSNAITTRRVGHAYLFTGARGVGKTSSARIFAKALNCIHGPTPTPCNQCEICVSIGTGEDIDVLEIDGASNRGIDEIRQLRMNASIRPSRARYKIYIIDEVHMLTREAFNALLKTLEEPPEHVKFIFCTTEPTKIPITILSRCQRFDFAGIDSSAIALRLNQIATQEGVSTENGVCELLARRANGSMRDAQSLLEQLLAFAPVHIRLVDVHGMLGTVDDQKIFNLLYAMVQSQPSDIFVVLNQASQEGVDFAVFIEQTMGVFRDLMAVASFCESKDLIYVSPERFDELKSLADQLGIQRILASLQILDQTHQRMRYSTQARILTELALIRLCHLDQLQQVSQLVESLRQGKFPSLTIPVSLDSEKKKSPESTSIRNAADERSDRDTLSDSKTGFDNIELSEKRGCLKKTSNPEKHITPGNIKSPDSFRNLENIDILSKKSETIQTEEIRDSDKIEHIEKINLSSMNDQLAKEIWQKTFLQSRQSSLSMLTGDAFKIDFDKPNRFIIYFTEETKLSYDYCQREIITIRSMLQKNFEEPIELRIEIDYSVPITKPVKPQLVNDQKNKWKVFRETKENPMIQKVIELFHAELKEVK